MSMRSVAWVQKDSILMVFLQVFPNMKDLVNIFDETAVFPTHTSKREI
jgi:hypothetical protein